MRRSVGVIFTVMTVAMIALSMISCSQEGSTAAGGPQMAVSHGAEGVEWETEWGQAFEKARAEGKVVVADFYADWCVWCKQMDTTTFKDAQVAGLMAAQAVPLKLDTDRGGRALAMRYGVQNLPTVVIFDGDGEELGRIPGYASPASFMRSLNGLLAREG